MYTNITQLLSDQIKINIQHLQSRHLNFIPSNIWLSFSNNLITYTFFFPPFLPPLVSLLFFPTAILAMFEAKKEVACCLLENVG
jgi:hypothetical protein